MVMETKLTLPSLNTQKHSSDGPPSRDIVAVNWNLAFSLDALLAFFCALKASQTPTVVGIPAMIRRPMTISP